MKYFSILQGCPLFAGIAETNLAILLDCLSARQKRLSKLIIGEPELIF